MRKTMTVCTIMLLALALASGAVAETRDYGGVTYSPTFASSHFGDVWDLTSGDLVLNYSIDLSGVTQSAANQTPYVEVGLREVGAGDFNPGPFNTYQGGAGGWMTSLVGDLATDPNNLDNDDKHNLSASGARGEGDYDVTAPAGPVLSPFGTSLTSGIWFDRDGVDPWQDDSAANTGGVYNIAISYHAINSGLGTMFATVNGLTTGFDTTGGDGFNIDTDPAGLSFTGDMAHMQVFTGAWWTGGAGGSVAVSDIAADGTLSTDNSPEPCTWLLLAATGVFGGIARRKRA